MNKKSWTVGMMIPFAAAAMVAAAPAASAKSVVAQKSGSCSKSKTHWTLKAKPDNGRMELELEIDSNRNGQRWTVKINDNGHRIYTGSRITHAPSGSFEIRKLTTNRAGVDHFLAVVHNARTGETCTARVNR